VPQIEQQPPPGWQGVQLSEQSACPFTSRKVPGAADAASKGVWSRDAACAPNSGTAGASVPASARPCPLPAHDKAAGSAAKLASEAAKTRTTTAKIIFRMSVLLEEALLSQLLC
jgi:hypothetical protein